MSVKIRNIIIDILGIILVLGAFYREIFTDKPLVWWVWLIITVVGVGMIVMQVKDLRGKFNKLINRVIKKKI